MLLRPSGWCMCLNPVKASIDTLRFQWVGAEMYPRQAWLVSSLAYIICHLSKWGALSFFHLSLPSMYSGWFPNKQPPQLVVFVMTVIILQWPQGRSPLLLRTQYHTMQDRGRRSPETPQLGRGKGGSLYLGVLVATFSGCLVATGQVMGTL